MRKLLSSVSCAIWMGFPRNRSRDRIWEVTYAPHYLEQNRELAEDQMRREIALPTPLHAADLQFQAFAEFDGSKALSQIRCPTLVLTGDLDRLIRPENSGSLAQTHSGSKARRHSRRRASSPVGGRRGMYRLDHRDFSHPFPTGPVHDSAGIRAIRKTLPPRNSLSSAAVLLAAWPLAVARAGCETLSARAAIAVARWLIRFGDGKPVVILAPHLLAATLLLLPFSAG